MSSNLRWVAMCLALSGCASAPMQPASPVEARSEPIEVGAGQDDPWSEFALPGKRRTRYRLQRHEGRPVVRAEADGSASMFRRRVKLEAGRVGRVHFSWRVDQLIQSADLRDRDAADSPVRVLFAFDGDAGRLSAHNRAMFELAQAITGEAPPYATLMYVWDNHAPLESVIPGGRSDRVRKIVLESGIRNVGRWRHYERDIVADFRRAFGEEPGALISVGLMTDADNTRSQASAWYGEIRFCAQPVLEC